MPVYSKWYVLGCVYYWLRWTEILQFWSSCSLSLWHMYVAIMQTREYQKTQSASCSLLWCPTQGVKSRLFTWGVHSTGPSSMPAGVKIPMVDIMNHLEDRCLLEVKTIIGHMICGYLYSQGSCLIYSNRSITGWPVCLPASQPARQPANKSASPFPSSTTAMDRQQGRAEAGSQACLCSGMASVESF